LGFLLAVVSLLSAGQGAQADTAPLVKEWFALGSGCKAKHNQPGDVSLTTLSKKSDPNAFSLTFRMTNYRLEGDKPVNPKNATFARECALRAAVEIPSGKRIRSLRSQVAFVTTKGVGTKVQLAAQAHLGNTIVDSEIITEDSSKNLHNQNQTLSLFATAQSSLLVSDTPFPSQTCGAAKLVGLDISVTNWRDSFVPQIFVSLASPAQVTLQLELEPCDQTPK
jgi:hypothetical protein